MLGRSREKISQLTKQTRRAPTIRVSAEIEPVERRLIHAPRIVTVVVELLGTPRGDRPFRPEALLAFVCPCFERDRRAPISCLSARARVRWMTSRMNGRPLP